MIKLNNKELESWKAGFAKDKITYNSDGEYYDAINNLVGLFDILIEIDKGLENSKDNKNDKMYVYDKDNNKVIL